jgi:hypothetical protein
VPYEEGWPAGRWFSVARQAHVLGNGSGRDLESQLRQLGLDPPLTLQDILRGHAPDQQSELAPDWLPIAIGRRTRPPTPIGPPSLPMPAKHRFRPHDEQRPAPAPEPAISQDPEPPISVRQPWLRVPTDEELLAET